MAKFVTMHPVMDFKTPLKRPAHFSVATPLLSHDPDMVLAAQINLFLQGEEKLRSNSSPEEEPRNTHFFPPTDILLVTDSYGLLI